jgi:hypothetical protein
MQTWPAFSGKTLAHAISILCIPTKVRDRKFHIFLSPRGINLSKIIGPWPNSNLICVFLWHICTWYFNIIHTSLQNLESENWNFLFFLSSRGITPPKTLSKYQTKTKFELDLRILLSHLYIQFQPYTYIPTQPFLGLNSRPSGPNLLTARDQNSWALRQLMYNYIWICIEIKHYHLKMCVAFSSNTPFSNE